MTAKTPTRYEICGNIYEFYPLSPDVSLRLLTRLTKILGEPLLKALAGVFSTRDGMELDEDGNPLGNEAIMLQLAKSPEARELIGQAVHVLSHRLDEDQVVDTIQKLLATAMVKRDGDNGTRQINFNLDFAGRTPELLLATKCAIEAEYGNFTDAFGGAIAARRL